MSRPAIEEATALLEGGDWAQALGILDIEHAAEHMPEVIELRAVATYGAGDFEGAVSAWEDLHRLFLEQDNAVEAARAASMIALYLMMDAGLMSPVRGWLGKAEQLLVGSDEVPAHALIAMVRTYERFMCGDMEAARYEADRSIELGKRLGVHPAVVIGGVASARIEILTGNMDRGLQQLDEMGALLLAGEVDPLTTGMMYCELVCAAQGLGLHVRVREWTEVMETWRHGAAFGGINGRCRVHRAEILRVSGPCDEAESEALLACEELRPWMRREFGWPLAELGTIRLRKGDLVGAEESLTEAHVHAWCPHPGLALLRLEQGDSDAALELITDALEHPMTIPSKERPPYGELWAVPLLEAQSEIAAAVADASAAESAAARLASIAAVHPGPGLEAIALLAAARSALLCADAEGAVKSARNAAVLWGEIGAPYAMATARLVLGDALHTVGKSAAAELEWRSASDAFERYGAKRRALSAAARLQPSAVSPVLPKPATTVLIGTFRIEGQQRVIGIGGDTVTVRELVGFRHLQRLLSDPGREFHVLDLVAVDSGTLRPWDSGASQSGLPVLDEQARSAYRRRLAEIEEDIDEATLANDLGRVELAERDRSYLVVELERAVGLSSRNRSVGGSSERARTAVTRSIRYALSRLEESHDVVAGHLRNCVRTGTYCSYHNDPVSPVTWNL